MSKRTAYIGEVSPTPLGPVWVATSDQGLVAVAFETDPGQVIQELERRGFGPVLINPERTAQAVQQLAEYLQGKRQAFGLQIDWSVVTPFQEKALRATLAIPFGQVATYGEIARQIGKPRAARAVGRAEATNPMPLVIPCHRVIGSDGGLHGYGGRGGIETKAWLLHLEGRS